MMYVWFFNIDRIWENPQVDWRHGEQFTSAQPQSPAVAKDAQERPNPLYIIIGRAGRKESSA